MPAFCARCPRFQATVVCQRRNGGAFERDERDAEKCAPDVLPVANVPGHFLKHVDEQTIVALEALRLALVQSGLDPARHTDWGGDRRQPFRRDALSPPIIVKPFSREGGGSGPCRPMPRLSSVLPGTSAAGAASIVLASQWSPALGCRAGDRERWAMACWPPLDVVSKHNRRARRRLGCWRLNGSQKPIPGQGRPGSRRKTTCHAGGRLAIRAGQFEQLDRGNPSADSADRKVAADDLHAEPTVSQLASCIQPGCRGPYRSPGRARFARRLGAVDLRLANAAQQYRTAA